MTIGDVIREYRKKNELSQRAFAEKCGDITNGYMSMIEKGKNPATGKPLVPSIEKLASIAKAMDMSLHHLIEITDDMPVYVGDQKQESGIVNQTTPEQLIVEPDIDEAALAATQTLIKYRVSALPIFPLSILQAMPDVIVVSFTELADQSGLDRDSLVMSFGEKSQDVVTITRQIHGKTHYSVAYNHRLPIGMLQFALARELGHIVLMHDESVPEDVRTTEALYFARYLLCPRPIIKAIQEFGVPITIEAFGNLTGFYGRSLAGIRKTPGAHISAELNRRVKQQFSSYIQSLSNYRAVIANDKSERATFGTYMDNYEE